MRTAVLDIECSALEAVGAGFLICAVIKEVGGKSKVFRYDKLHCRPAHEKRLVEELLRELESYDLVITHNGEKFDWNYLKSRAYRLGVPVRVHPLSYDTLRAFRRCGFKTRDNGFGKPTASLDFVVDFLGLSQDKTKLYPAEHWKTVWEKGEARDAAIRGLVTHCLKDVEMTEEVYRALLPQDAGAIIRRLR